MLVFVAVQRLPCRRLSRGWALTVRGPRGSRTWERDRILEKKSINDKDETSVCVPTPLGISPVSVNLSGPPDSGAKVTCE